MKEYLSNYKKHQKFKTIFVSKAKSKLKLDFKIKGSNFAAYAF